MRNKSIKKVDLFIVGAAKSGTTSLADYLKKIDGIFVPEMKEPFYFVDADIGVSNEIEYNSLYAKSKAGDILVDASTGYIFDQKACQNIKNYNSKAKILIIIRNPIDMAFSLWSYMMVNGVEDRDLLTAFKSNKPPDSYTVQGWNCNYLYKARASYYEQITRYQENFENVMIITFEELIKNTRETLTEIFKFIEIDPNKIINYQLPISNEGGNARFKLAKVIRDKQYPTLKKLLPPAIRSNIRRLTRKLVTGKGKIKITNSQREELKKAFTCEVRKIKDLGIDTTFWKDF